MRYINLSASSIKDFLVCSKRYFYRINSPEFGVPTVPMKVGTLVHKVMESAHIDTYGESYKKGLIEVAKLNFEAEDKKFALNKLKQSLTNYNDYFRSLTHDDDVIEMKFRIPVDSGASLVGRIDRLNSKQGIVIDWKTSTRDPYQINTDIQFLLYRHAFLKLYHKVPSLVLYANVFTGKLISLIDENNVDYNKLIDKTIPEITARIKKSDFKLEGRAKRGACDQCPYKIKCFEDNPRKARKY